MSTPEYLERHELEVVESDIINIHGALGAEEVQEKQRMVVGTKTLKGEDWVNARYFAYMVGFLYFNKIFQVPMLIASKKLGISIKEQFEHFLKIDEKSDNQFQKIKKYFRNHARNMQKGGPEFDASEAWLNVWWPPDELAFINVVTSGSLKEMYEDMICELLSISGEETSNRRVIEDAADLNAALIKLPNQDSDESINLGHNVWDVYNSILNGKEEDIIAGDFIYRIDKTSDTWSDWPEWCEKVVWWGNKKGAYLYNCTGLDEQNQEETIEKEPFGTEAR